MLILPRRKESNLSLKLSASGRRLGHLPEGLDYSFAILYFYFFYLAFSFVSCKRASFLMLESLFICKGRPDSFSKLKGESRTFAASFSNFSAWFNHSQSSTDFYRSSALNFRRATINSLITHRKFWHLFTFSLGV